MKTPKPIGPHFGDELRAAGLHELPIGWGDDGSFTFGEDMTDEQVAAVMAVYEAHEPEAETAAKVMRQIEALEARKGRAMREAVLTGDKSRLQAIDDDIAALRGRL